MKDIEKSQLPPGADSELIWGIHPVLELLRARPRQLREVVIQKGKAGPRVQEIIDLARAEGVKLRFEPRLRMPPGAGKESHQGVLARISARAVLPLEDFLASLRLQPDPVLLAVDTIQDPHNLGAIVRAASAAGAAGIILTRDRTAPLSGTVEKAAAGALAHMDLCQVTNLAVTLGSLKKEGFWIYGAAGEAANSIYRTDFSRGPLCLVIGSEEKGIRPLVREQCDLLVSIPMRSSLDSLNAAAAAAVILFEVVRQRQTQDC
jgi:23S rRNA (guanosine2251-2'-O)-methyltransferase